MNAARWPGWWEWELELTPHLERRMEELLVVITAYKVDQA